MSTFFSLSKSLITLDPSPPCHLDNFFFLSDYRPPSKRNYSKNYPLNAWCWTWWLLHSSSGYGNHFPPIPSKPPLSSTMCNYIYVCYRPAFHFSTYTRRIGFMLITFFPHGAERAELSASLPPCRVVVPQVHRDSASMSSHRREQAVLVSQVLGNPGQPRIVVLYSHISLTALFFFLFQG